MAICIVIPVFNEYQRLPVAAFSSFVQTQEDAYLLFVDDASTDGSRQRIAEISALYPQRVQCLVNPHNMGKANTIRQGMLQAFAHLPVQYIGFLDADLAVQPAELIRFAGILNTSENHGVYGCRDWQNTHAVNRNPLRKIMGNLFKWYVNKAFKFNMADTQCGAKLFKRQIVPAVFGQPFVTRWLADIEILLRLKSNYNQLPVNQLVEQATLTYFEDKPGSKLNTKELFRMVKELASLTAAG